MTAVTPSFGRADSAPADLAPCSLRGAWVCACGGAWKVQAPGRKEAPGPSPHPGRLVQTWKFRPISRFCEAHRCPPVGGFGTSLRFRTARTKDQVLADLRSSQFRGCRERAQQGRNRTRGVGVGQPGKRRSPLSFPLSCPSVFSVPSFHTASSSDFSSSWGVCRPQNFQAVPPRSFTNSSENSLRLRKMLSAHNNL